MYELEGSGHVPETILHDRNRLHVWSGEYMIQTQTEAQTGWQSVANKYCKQ